MCKKYLWIYSTLPRTKKEISYPLLSRDDKCTAKTSSEGINPGNDCENLRDQVQFVITTIV